MISTSLASSFNNFSSLGFTATVSKMSCLSWVLTIMFEAMVSANLEGSSICLKKDTPSIAMRLVTMAYSSNWSSVWRIRALSSASGWVLSTGYSAFAYQHFATGLNCKSLIFARAMPCRNTFMLPSGILSDCVISANTPNL